MFPILKKRDIPEMHKIFFIINIANHAHYGETDAIKAYLEENKKVDKKKLNRKVVLDLNKVKKVKIYPDKLKLYTKHCYTVYTKDKKIIKHISNFLKED